MLYRTVVFFIWIFWAVMVALLIRSEYFPDQASLYRLPVEFVARKVFRSDTGSDLTIYYKDARVGRARIEPAPISQNVMKGSVMLDWPVLGKRYESESYFAFIFNSKLDVQQFNLSSRSDQTSVFLEGNRVQNRINATFQMAGNVINRKFNWAELEKNPFQAVSTELQQGGMPQIPQGLLVEAGKELKWYGASTTLRRKDKSSMPFSWPRRATAITG